MIQFATVEQAAEVVRHWGGESASLVHLGNSASSVFEYKKDGVRHILRLTDAAFRTATQIEGELEYLTHLKGASVSACEPVPATEGALLVARKWGTREWVCSSLTFVPGLYVDESSPHWNRDFFKAWGRSLASIHAASKEYQPPIEKLWHWEEEIIIQKRETLLPKQDVLSRKEWDELYGTLSGFPKTRDTYGMIHADHAPQNFRFDPVTGGITAFDFGNSCYHWYLADLANALSTVQSKPEAYRIKEGILEGYSEMASLPNDYEEQLALFLRLRALYVYLDRLYTIGEHPDEYQKSKLERLKAVVHTYQSDNKV